MWRQGAGQNFPVATPLSTSVKLTLHTSLSTLNEMRNERSNACCGPWPDKSWIWISSPFAGAAGTIFFLDRLPRPIRQYDPIWQGTVYSFPHHVLGGEILDRTLRILDLDKMRMPLFGCGDKAALFAGPK